MASQVYNEAIRAIMAGEYDLNNGDYRARLVMANSTAGSQNDGVIDFADITTVDKADATGYADVALTTETVTKEDASDRAIFTSDSVVFSGLGGDASRNYIAVVIYKYVDGTDANDLVISYNEFATPITLAATQVTVPCPTAGWVAGTKV